MDKVAKRYARALFDSVKKEQLNEMRSLLTSFAELFSANKDLGLALLSPAYPMKERESALHTLSEQVSGGNAPFSGLLRLLLRNKRLNLIDEVAEAFSSMVDQYQKLFSLSVTSAFQISEEERNKMISSIRQQLGSSVEVKWDINKDLIGGMKVGVGDMVLDNSIETALKRIEQQLTQ